jgi:hypothetical protein
MVAQRLGCLLLQRLNLPVQQVQPFQEKLQDPSRLRPVPPPSVARSVGHQRDEMPTLSQYSSLNDPDGFGKIEMRQGFASSVAPGIVAEFPLDPTLIVTVAAGYAFFVEDFLQHLVMELGLALRGE